MDFLELQIEQRKNDSFIWEVVTPFINGKSLIEIIKPIEAEYESSIAGDYGGLLVKDFFEDYQLNKIPNLEKTPLLACSCGSFDCWGLQAKIIYTSDTVQWLDFEQIHRENWNYPLKFEFSKDKYWAEFQKISSSSSYPDYSQL